MKDLQLDIDLWKLSLKERWEDEDIAEFWRLRKLKFWDNRIKNTSWLFYQIRKHHTKPTSKWVRSWKECVMKFHYEWFESLSTESNKKFEWIEVPFTPYHQDIVDCDIVKIIGIRWIYKRYNHTYYLCSWEFQWMWLIAKEAPDSFRNLNFDDRGSIDYIEKDWKFIDISWERKAYQIYKDKI